MNLLKLWSAHDERRPWLCLLVSLLFGIINFGAVVPPADAVITGGKGNVDLPDPGWPKGSHEIFNSRFRIAWWEGPPFGGGQYTAEFRGDKEAFNAMLARFAKLKVKTKRLVIHDGVGKSFWLSSNRESGKHQAAAMDWSFMVWVAAKWDCRQDLPERIKKEVSFERGDASQGPPVELRVYTGGLICWADVIIPEGVIVIDRRKETPGKNKGQIPRSNFRR